MAAVDRNAAALGVPRRQLMESSGNAVARAVKGVADPGAAVAVVAGRGNNGGDGFAAARFLDDYDSTVHLLGRPATIRTDIAAQNWAALEAGAYDTRTVRDQADLALGDPDVVVDAMLGTGVSGALREPERSAARAVNDADATVVAVDVPTGVDPDTGERTAGAVDADTVVTFHDLKPGLADIEGVTVADIGIPAAAERFVGPGDLLALDRAAAAHKGTFGQVGVIGGGPYAGAPALAAQAALRAGADLAVVHAPEAAAREIQGYSENLIVEAYPGDRLAPDRTEDLLGAAGDHDVVVLGPGLGGSDETAAAAERFLAGYDGRAVVDADALAAVSAVETAATLVCTPHRGELEELGGPDAEGWRERADRLEAFAADLGVTVLAKGPYDIASDGAETRVNRTGNPGMTVGGTGDVLAGATGALLARLDPLKAAAVGAYAVGRAGDAAAEDGEAGLVATDLLGELPGALEDR